MEPNKDEMTLITAKSNSNEYFVCNICGSTKVYFNFNATVSPSLYEPMFETGLTRCGNDFYQINNYLTCCRFHQVRVSLDDFKPTKDQLKKYNRFNNYVKNKGKPKEIENIIESEFSAELTKICMKMRLPVTNLKISKAKESKKHYLACKYFSQLNRTSPGDWVIPTLTKLVEEGNSALFFDSKTNLVFFDKFPPKSKPNQPRKLYFALEEPVFSEEKFELFLKYMDKRHNNKKYEGNRKAFKDWQCVSGLSSDKEYGTKHLVCRLDGELLFVSVVDLLPSYFISRYCFYSTSYPSLSLGTVASFLEVEIAKQHPTIRYYSLDHYIHPLKNTLYKLDFGPVEVLCCSTFKFRLYEGDITMFDKRHTAKKGQIVDSESQEASLFVNNQLNNLKEAFKQGEINKSEANHVLKIAILLTRNLPKRSLSSIKLIF